ncbi:MAG: polysaccharide deacetylase family protein [Thermovirgaceae bacterium]
MKGHRAAFPLFFVTAVVILSVYSVAAASLSSPPRPVMHGPDSIRAVALTFDDGPHRWHTPELLDILRKWDVKASFFVVGQCVAENPRLLQKIHEEGHCIANHSWSHPDLTRFSKKTLVDEIRFCNQVVEALTGGRPKFFRPPGGRWNDEVLSVASEENLLSVLWTVNAYDVPPKPPEELAELILRRTRPGAIVLLHDGGGATAEALPIIIERLLSEDYLFVTLDQMFPTRIPPIPLSIERDDDR